MNFPADLKYTKDHEWIRVDGAVAYIGITDYAQSELGEIVFVDITTEGEVVAKEEVFGTIEAVKTVSVISNVVLDVLNATVIPHRDIVECYMTQTGMFFNSTRQCEL